MRLNGRLCSVRRWTADDVDALVRHADNLNVARQLRDRFPHPYTRANAIAFLKHATAGDPPTTLAIEVDRQAVGGIGYVAGTDVERYTAEIGYWLSEQYWGRGIVTEALVLVTTFVFAERNLLRLFAVPFADNVGSTRVLEKAGYVFEGIMRSSSVKHGQPRDQAMYALVNPSWKGPSGG
jgi:ribosomal-protein-alanine N-acetyltransferase